jgi:vacuolar-type H+-ATPase subunit F/Vma7
MRAALHAIGRSIDMLPLLALGASLHEVDSLQQAQETVRELDRQGEQLKVLILLSEQFAEAEAQATESLVVVLPGTRPSERDSLEKTRELVSRSVGVDLIAKSKRMVRKDG